MVHGRSQLLRAARVDNTRISQVSTALPGIRARCLSSGFLLLLEPANALLRFFPFHQCLLGGAKHRGRLGLRLFAVSFLLLGWDRKTIVLLFCTALT